jgi:hypothetical protein
LGGVDERISLNQALHSDRGLSSVLYQAFSRVPTQAPAPFSAPPRSAKVDVPRRGTPKSLARRAPTPSDAKLSSASKCTALLAGDLTLSSRGSTLSDTWGLGLAIARFGGHAPAPCFWAARHRAVTRRAHQREETLPPALRARRGLFPRLGQMRAPAQRAPRARARAQAGKPL